MGLLITSCGDDDPIIAALEGNLYIPSIPADAEIWIEGVNTSQTTPDTVFDIYYFSNAIGSSYLIQSADLAGLTRETDFRVGTGTNLLDGDDSPLRNTGTWTNNIDEPENNYVFLYDHDAHYSKFLIVNRGGGTGLGDPAYVDVQWFYNKVVQDNRFK